MRTDDSYFVTSTESTAVDADNPWPGLLAYQEADQQYFHGRDGESAELLRLVMRERLTVLFSMSGLGKSSLLQAGLFPYLRQQDVLPIYIRLGFSPDHPSLKTQVKQAIALESAAAGVEAPAGKEDETFWEYFHRQDADFWNGRNRLTLPLLVFDQFEEIFTLGRSVAQASLATETFLGELSDLIESRPPAALKEHLDEHPKDAGKFSFTRRPCKILLSLREDYLPELEELRERIPSIVHNRMRLRRMNGEAAWQVVAQARHLIEPAVARQVVDFVAAGQLNLLPEQMEVEPALLSVVCRELNNKRQQRRESLITEDLLEGSREEILSDFYERAISDQAPEVRSFVEEQLLTVSGYRDSVALENALNTPGITREVIDLLMERRLLRREERAGIHRLEITHDLLTRVISASRDRRRQGEAEQQRQKEITEQERQKRLEERASSARRFLWLSVALALLFLLTLYAFYRAGQQTKRAERQLEIANKQREIANKERSLANEAESLSNKRLQRITESIKLRQAVLSRDKTALAKAFEKTSVAKEIIFRVTAKEYPYKAVGGLPTYKFQLFPVEQSIPGGFKSIALITYIMDHPTFLNPLISTGPDTKFTGTYDGVGCLNKVIAVIEYAAVDKPLAIAEFNMCERLAQEK